MNELLVRTMTGQLTVHIRERILAGQYPPGTQLLQDSIAAEFGVSKIPVREALVQLRSEGLVDVYAHRGFQVRAVSVQEMQEVYRLRLDIEPEAVAIGARIASDEDHAAAKAALVAEAKAVAAKDTKASGGLNAVFHLALIVPRLQPVTNEVLQRLYTLCERYVRMHLQPAGRPKRSTKEHGRLLDAWLRGNAKEAQRLVHAHIEEIRDDLTAALLEQRTVAEAPRNGRAAKTSRKTLAQR
jgi:DNA-binding GntR family transcriptional regulator